MQEIRGVTLGGPATSRKFEGPMTKLPGEITPRKINFVIGVRDGRFFVCSRKKQKHVSKREEIHCTHPLRGGENWGCLRVNCHLR